MGRKSATRETRRKFIKSVGAAGTVALAGCGGNGGGDGGSDGGSTGNAGSDSYEITFWEPFSGGEGPIMENIVIAQFPFWKALLPQSASLVCCDQPTSPVIS